MSNKKCPFPISSIIREDSWVTIKSFMVDELNLKGVKLFAYAIIYGYSLSNRGIYDGSVKYICAWANSGETAVRQALKELTEEGLINKITIQQNNVVFNNYTANRRPFSNLSESDTPYQKVIPPLSESDTPFILYNNNNINKDKLENNIIAPTQKKSVVLASPTSSAHKGNEEKETTLLFNQPISFYENRIGKIAASLLFKPTDMAIYKALSERQREIVLEVYEQKKRIKKKVTTQDLTEMKFIAKYPISVIEEMLIDFKEKGWQSLIHHDLAKKIQDKQKQKNNKAEVEDIISVEETTADLYDYNSVKDKIQAVVKKMPQNAFNEVFSESKIAEINKHNVKTKTGELMKSLINSVKYLYSEEEFAILKNELITIYQSL